jgi:hypothetical protein
LIPLALVIVSLLMFYIVLGILRWLEAKPPVTASGRAAHRASRKR